MHIPTRHACCCAFCVRPSGLVTELQAACTGRRHPYPCSFVTSAVTPSVIVGVLDSLHETSIQWCSVYIFLLMICCLSAGFVLCSASTAYAFNKVGLCNDAPSMHAFQPRLLSASPHLACMAFMPVQQPHACIPGHYKACSARRAGPRPAM